MSVALVVNRRRSDNDNSTEESPSMLLQSFEELAHEDDQNDNTGEKSTIINETVESLEKVESINKGSPLNGRAVIPPPPALKSKNKVAKKNILASNVSDSAIEEFLDSHVVETSI